MHRYSYAVAVGFASGFLVAGCFKQFRFMATTKFIDAAVVAISAGGDLPSNSAPTLSNISSAVAEVVPSVNALIGDSNILKATSEAYNITKIDVSSSHGILVTSHKSDDSIIRLASEFGRGIDRYNINDMKTDPDSKSAPLILDIGGNIGFISIAFAKIHSTAQIIVFEPNPFTYFYLRWNLFLNGLHVLSSEELKTQPKKPGVFPVFGGLGGGSKPYIMTPMPANPFERSQNNLVDYEESEDGGVPIYSLSHFMDSHGLTKRGFDVVKMDCECCEYLVMPANKEIFSDINKVKSMVGELHPFSKCGKNFKLPKAAQDAVVDILEARNCSLKASDFDENGFIGHATDGPCCPDIC